jgi:hypothetical protein
VVALPTPDPSPLGAIAQSIPRNGDSARLSQPPRSGDQLAGQPLGNAYARTMAKLAATGMERIIKRHFDRVDWS